MKEKSVSKSRRLRLSDIIVAGLSGAVGFEIFILLNYAYFRLAGPAIVIAIALGGIINLLIMLSYSELSAAMPLVGGEYTYIKSAYGGYVGFIFGCFRWLASIFAAALAAVAFVLQLAFLFSIFSTQLQSIILGWSWLIAILIVAVMGIAEVRGIRRFGSLIVVTFLLLFTGFIVGGFLHGVSQVNLSPETLPLGFSGVFAAIVYIFPMFIGTKALVASAPSAEKPEKDIPKALLLSAVLIIPLYLLLAIVAVGTVPSEAAQQIPLLNFAANIIFGSYGGAIFAVAGMVACLSALGTSLSVQSSIARGLSRDGYFPKILLSVHSRFGTFHVAAIVGSIFIMMLGVLGAVPFLGYAASFGSLLVFALVNLSLIKLRKTKPHMDRPFKTPLYPITPILGVLLSLALLAGPVLFGDGNAVDALSSGIGLTALVLCSYYLRMAGRYRIQVAFGGVGIGMGITLALISLFNIAGFINPVFPFIPNYVKLVFSLVFLVTGFFNLKASKGKPILEIKNNNQVKPLKKLREYIGKKFKLAV